MNYSTEYLSFLEAHRQAVEFKDKMKQAALVHIEKKIEASLSERSWDQYKEDTV